MRRRGGTGKPAKPLRRKVAGPKQRKPAGPERRPTPSVAQLREQNATLTRELSEAREQQTASSEVLKRHLQFARRIGAGVPGHAGECDPYLRGQIRHGVSLRWQSFPSGRQHRYAARAC